MHTHSQSEAPLVDRGDDVVEGKTLLGGSLDLQSLDKRANPAIQREIDEPNI